MSILSKTLSIVLALMSLGTLNAAIADELKPWDQTNVLKISDDLSSASRRLQIECRSSPPKYFEETSGQHLMFRYHVRHFLSISYKLNNALEDGAGKDETQPLFEVLANMKDDLNGYANTPGGPWLAVQKAVKNVDMYLTQLEGYYE